MGSSGGTAALPAAAEARLTALETTAASTSTQQTTLGTRLTAAETAATALTARVTALETATAGLAALETRLAAAEAKLAARTQGVGTIVSNIAVGGVWPCPIVFDKTMPDNTYAVVSVEIEGVSGISGVLTPVLPATARTTTGCTVSVKNNALLAIGASATVRVTVEKL